MVASPTTPFKALATEVVRCVKGDASNENTGWNPRFFGGRVFAPSIPNGNYIRNREVRMNTLLEVTKEPQ